MAELREVDADSAAVVHLQACCCAVQTCEQGDVCEACGYLGQWEGDHIDYCAADACDARRGAELTECAGCNYTWHRSCHASETGAHMASGIGRFGEAASWCKSCVAELGDTGALRILARRGRESASSSFAGSKRAAEPGQHLKRKKMRVRKKTMRVRSTPMPTLEPCKAKHKWSFCKNCKGSAGLECARVTAEQRQLLRAQFHSLRNDQKPMAP